MFNDNQHAKTWFKKWLWSDNIVNSKKGNQGMRGSKRFKTKRVNRKWKKMAKLAQCDL